MDAPAPDPAAPDPAADNLNDPYAAARNNMVDSQVRPNKVTHAGLLDAMRRLPRELFVPPAQASRAYADEDVPLPGGRVLMEPMVIARLLQLAQPRPGERALVVAAGPGYGSALLAVLGVAVTALESDPALARAARSTLAAVAPGVALTEGPLAAGAPAGAPYDLILIEGAVRAIPVALASQLASSGRLVTVIAGVRGGVAVIAGVVAGTFRERAAFDCATPPIAALLPPAVFEF